MTPENRQQLFQVSEKIPPTKLESIYQVPVEFQGFKPIGREVFCNDPTDVLTLIPEYNYPKVKKNYEIFDAVCIFDQNKPILAFVRGIIHGKRLDDKTGEYTNEAISMVSMVNLSPDSEKVFIVGKKIKLPLINYTSPNHPDYDDDARNIFWPGCQILDNAKIVIKKSGTEYSINFKAIQQPQGV